jgi:hypothetical protein
MQESYPEKVKELKLLANKYRSDLGDDLTKALHGRQARRLFQAEDAGADEISLMKTRSLLKF